MSHHSNPESYAHLNVAGLPTLHGPDAWHSNGYSPTEGTLSWVCEKLRQGHKVSHPSLGAGWRALNETGGVLDERGKLVAELWIWVRATHDDGWYVLPEAFPVRRTPTLHGLDDEPVFPLTRKRITHRLGFPGGYMETVYEQLGPDTLRVLTCEIHHTPKVKPHRIVRIGAL